MIETAELVFTEFESASFRNSGHFQEFHNSVSLKHAILILRASFQQLQGAITRQKLKNVVLGSGLNKYTRS